MALGAWPLSVDTIRAEYSVAGRPEGVWPGPELRISARTTSSAPASRSSSVAITTVVARAAGARRIDKAAKAKRNLCTEVSFGLWRYGFSQHTLKLQQG